LRFFRFLASRKNAVVTRDEILNKVWGLEAYPVTRTVDNHIASLRAKLETNPRRLPTSRQCTESGTNRPRRRSMKRFQLALGVLLAMALSIGLAAQSAQDLYQRGLVQEHSKGDLKQAIALYTKAAQAAGKDRALAAKALIRMGGAQEKLGAEPDAEKTYDELLRVYPEQRAEVVVAQERLKALRRAARLISSNRLVRVERVPDAEVAVRLAAFLWNDIPDGQLAEVARRGELDDPGVLKRQVVRMLRDHRSDALLDNFFAKWLALDKLKTAKPDLLVFPKVDSELLEAMGTETRLFVQSQLREDRDAMELWTAPYTFVNERLARHYGLPGISGRDFRRVTRMNPNRAGLLGQASILTALSKASRTSPTSRGIYVSSGSLGSRHSLRR
jgi:hypothetical protein